MFARMGIWLGCLVLPLTVAFADNSASPTERPTFQASDMFSLRGAYDPRIAPDGTRIVYVQVRANMLRDEYESSLWMVGSDGRDNHPLTEGQDSADNPRWSPDGRRIAYLATRGGARQIVIRWVDSGIETMIGGLSATPSNMEWSPDGRLLAFTMPGPSAARQIGTALEAPPGASWKPGPMVIDRTLYRFDGMGYLPRGEMQFFVVSADGGPVRRIADGSFGNLPVWIGNLYEWTPDSRGLLTTLNHHSEAEIAKGKRYDTGLYLIPLDGSAITRVIDRDGAEMQPSVSPDGRYVAYVGYDEERRSYSVPQLFIVDRKTGERRALTATLDRDIGSPRWAANGKGIYAYFTDHGMNRLALFDLSGKYRVITSDLGTPATAYTFGYSGNPQFTVARNGAIALQWATAATTGDIAAATTNGKISRVTQLNDELLQSRKLARIEEINYVSSAGQLPIQGWVLYPADFDPRRQYPLILEIHGGPAACYGPRFDAEKQLMAGAGYVVVYTNPRGSTGYGAQFGNHLQDDFPGHEYEDLMSGVDAVLARGGIDQQHLYVTGGSGGGTLTAWLISHTQRFKSAAVLYPVVDFRSEALTSDILPDVVYGFFHDTPWNEPQLYGQHSVLSYAGKVTTPTLIMAGEIDYRTPISQSEQYYAALRYHGVDSALVRFPQESHGILAYPSHWAAKIATLIGWFDEHR